MPAWVDPGDQVQVYVTAKNCEKSLMVKWLHGASFSYCYNGSEPEKVNQEE
jgi:hypothetical protein